MIPIRISRVRALIVQRLRDIINVKIVSKLYAKIRSIEFEHFTESYTIFLKSGKSKNSDGRNSVNNQDTMNQKSHMIILLYPALSDRC